MIKGKANQSQRTVCLLTLFIFTENTAASKFQHSLAATGKAINLLLSCTHTCMCKLYRGRDFGHYIVIIHCTCMHSVYCYCCILYIGVFFILGVC